MERCPWSESSELMRRYHDQEWGVPLHDDRKLFEFLVLESVQAGLSWSTVLNKRENYRAALQGFDVEAVAAFGEAEMAQLMVNAGLIRNRQKMQAIVSNARAFLEVQAEFGSFDTWSWQFVDHQPIVNQWQSPQELPSTSPESDAMSKALKQRGFKFVGSTICYAHMQATGMINDHLTSCFRYQEI